MTTSFPVRLLSRLVGRHVAHSSKNDEMRGATYDHAAASRFTLADCEGVVSKRAALYLTGIIVEADESSTGPFVKFQPDDRYGFGDFRVGIDLDALDVVPRGERHG